MVSQLLTRVEKLEARVAPSGGILRCWSVVCDQGDEEAGEVLAHSHGFDPDDDSHLLMLHSIVTPDVQHAAPRAAYVLGANS